VTSIAALLLLEDEEGDVVVLESPTSMEEPLSIGVGILFLVRGRNEFQEQPKIKEKRVLIPT